MIIVPSPPPPGAKIIGSVRSSAPGHSQTSAFDAAQALLEKEAEQRQANAVYSLQHSISFDGKAGDWIAFLVGTATVVDD